MSEIKLVLDGARLAELLRSPSGPVGRHLIERGEMVKQGGRANAPRKSGCLANTIVKRVEENPETGFVIRVISDTSPCSPDRRSYSLDVHEGTRPHIILPKQGKVLAFEMGGELIFASAVKHPGTRAQPFLRDALPLAAI